MDFFLILACRSQGGSAFSASWTPRSIHAMPAWWWHMHRPGACLRASLTDLLAGFAVPLTPVSF